MRRALWPLTMLAFLQLNAPARAVEFAEMVRTLNAMQNRMTIGDAAARDQAAKQFDLIEKTIETIEPDGWSDERTLRAAILYLLCGGAPGSLREIHEAGFATGKLASLLAASVEYADGRDGGAPKALMEFDPREFPSMLGGHLALVQGGALMGEDTPRAMALLDLARLLMPGSLVEEAALRREISILDPVRESDKLALLSVRYVSKYLMSPYAQHFWDVLRRVTVDDPTFLPRSAKFDPVFAKAPSSDRPSLYLALARQALLAGKFDEAKLKIDKAGEAAASSASEKRVGVYRNIVAALTQDGAAEALRAVDVSELDKKDAALVAMASSVTAGLAAKKPEVPADDNYEIATTLRQAIAQSDELLKRAGSQ